MKRYGFARKERLSGPGTIRAVFDRGRVRRSAEFALRGLPNGLPHSRFAVVLSRKIKGSIVRNRIKRLFREAYRMSKHDLPCGYDLVAVPHSPGGLTLQRIRQSLVALASMFPSTPV